ncbi:unnamed protein product [Rotaria sordida]|uniref:Uncharacterized protein n=1 Tax=Rotaria sordida TaxID=392033 RepID=A0A815U7L3_9BILA|nr:unnamed protein product [Rotaria sordida]
MSLTIRKLKMVSLIELFLDIVPDYQCARKTLPDNHLTKNKHKQIKTIEPSKLNLGYLAIQCLCKLLTYLHHFDFRRNVYNVTVEYTTSR